MNRRQPMPVKKGNVLSFISGLFLAFLIGYLALVIYSSWLWVTDGYETAFNQAVFHLNDEVIGSEAITHLFTAKPVSNLIESLVSATGNVKHYTDSNIVKPLDNMVAQNDFGALVSSALSEKNSYIGGEKLTKVITSSKKIGALLSVNAQIVLCKAILLVFAAPLFLVFAFIGLIDGLNQRAIRKAELGRESSYVFHRLTHYLTVSLMMVLGLWIALPFNLNHQLVFVPASMLLGGMVLQTASRFKKHL